MYAETESMKSIEYSKRNKVNGSKDDSSPLCDDFHTHHRSYIHGTHLHNRNAIACEMLVNVVVEYAQTVKHIDRVLHVFILMTMNISCDSASVILCMYFLVIPIAMIIIIILTEAKGYYYHQSVAFMSALLFYMNIDVRIDEYAEGCG